MKVGVIMKARRRIVPRRAEMEQVFGVLQELMDGRMMHFVGDAAWLEVVAVVAAASGVAQASSLESE